MRRWIVPIVAVGVVVSAVVLLRSRPLDVRVPDIKRVALDPYPEGPPGPTFIRGERPDGEVYLPFEQIERFIPDPLPNTSLQGVMGVTCKMGGNLIVTLKAEIRFATARAVAPSRSTTCGRTWWTSTLVGNVALDADPEACPVPRSQLF